jgi:uncharacterized protein (TIGR00297 family)
VTAFSETQRQIVHVSMAAFALLLRYLTWPQAALLAAGALAFNAFALASVAPRIVRSTGVPGVGAGILFYPLSVLVLVFAFRERLDLVAGAWGVMAFGDGFATIVGTSTKGPRLPWNPQKSWNGFAAFVGAGTIGAIALMTWVAHGNPAPPTREFVLFAAFAATVVAAFVETLRLRLDDNLSVPAAAGVTLWFSSQIDQPIPGWTDLAGALLVSVPVALLVWRTRALTLGGAITGAICAVLIYLGAYLAGIVVLGIALLLTIITSGLGRACKLILGPEEDGEGRRGAGNIAANCGVGALGGALAAFSADWSGEAGALLIVTAIAAGASDTVASEIGKAFGGRPRAFPSFRAVPPGTPGAVSAAGTLAGAAAAAVIALPAVAMWLLPPDRLWLVVAACTAGAFAESALATRFERSGGLDNHTLNVINTACAAVLAVWWASL